MIKSHLHPALLRPPHRVTHPEKLDDLTEAFLTGGWDDTKSPLVGYHDRDVIQLITGSHRVAAALRANITVPVVVFEKAQVEAAWGNLEQWKDMIEQT